MLRFLYGKNLREKNVEFKPGTFYLDTATNELWFDDPSLSEEEKHQKIIDIETLVFTTDGSIDFNFQEKIESELGIAVLGTMILGID